MIRPRVSPEFIRYAPAAVRSESWIYVHRAADGSALYIGCSINPTSRTRDHFNNAAWWPEVESIEWHGPVANRADAELREEQMIRELRPRENVQFGRRVARNVTTVEAAQTAVAHAEGLLRVARYELEQAELAAGAA